jgi:hypothetical protein
MSILAFGLVALQFKLGRAASSGGFLAATDHDPLPLLGAAVLTLLGLGLAVQATKLVPWFATFPSALAAHWRGVALGVTVAGFAGSIAIVWVLRAFPNSGDEYAFLFEANTFGTRYPRCTNSSHLHA